MLTELEGAILSEVFYRGRQTAFQVRRSFADSPSLEWKATQHKHLASEQSFYKLPLLA